VHAIKRISLAVLLVGFLPIAAAEDPQKINITPEIDFIEDAAGAMTFTDISKPNEGRWKKIGAEATRFSFSRSVFWLRFDLNRFERYARLGQLYLVFEWKALDSLELFPAPGPGRMIAGDAFPKRTWSLTETHFPAFQITPAMNPRGIYYVRLESTSIKNFPIFLKSETNYLRELKDEVTLIFVYLTVVVILILFAAFMFAMSRDTTFLLYLSYLIAIALAFNTTFGNAFDMLWPEATWWQNRAGFTLVGVQIVFSTLFVSRLLDFPRYLPKADTICNAIAAICFVSLPFSLTNLPVVWFSAFYSVVYLVSIPAFFMVGIYLLPKAGSHVRLFIAGWGIFFFFAIFHILYLRNVLPFSNFYVYSPIFALPVDILFFFISIWEKQREGDRERLRLLDEKMEALIQRSPGESKAKYHKSSLTEVDVKGTLARMDILMNQEKIYLIEDLRLPDLAKALGLDRTQLSELLNSHFHKNFTQFINEYRVQEAQKLLVEAPGQNVLEIAFATGFGSKAAFSSEFKRVTGTTAKEFREKNLEKLAS